jgi:hypothetical protein
MMSAQVRTCRLCGSNVDGYRPYDCSWLEWNLFDGCLSGLSALGLMEVGIVQEPRRVESLPEFMGLSMLQSINHYNNISS